MLVLWGVTPELGEARAALDGSGLPITAILTDRYRESVLGDTEPGKITVTAVIKAMWKQREVHAELRDAATSGAFKRVLRAGAQTKDFLARAEAQLGVAPS
jgi:hypothetical protein